MSILLSNRVSDRFQPPFHPPSILLPSGLEGGWKHFAKNARKCWFQPPFHPPSNHLPSIPPPRTPPPYAREGSLGLATRRRVRYADAALSS